MEQSWVMMDAVLRFVKTWVVMGNKDESTVYKEDLVDKINKILQLGKTYMVPNAIVTKSFTVTLWDEVVSKEMYELLDKTCERLVVSIINFVIHRFRGFCLSSNQSSLVMANMENQFYEDLRAWKD